jgi:hypothetical protein
MPSGRYLAIVVVALVAVCGTAAAQDDPLPAGVAAIPGTIEDVRVAGTWDRGGESGVYRVVISRTGGDNVTARLFVQWVAYLDDGGAAVRDTIEIKELAALGVDIVDYSSESDGNVLSVVIQTLDPNGSNDLSYALKVVSPTQYSFAPASN